MIGSYGFHSVSGRARRIVSVDQVDPVGGDVAIVTLSSAASVRQVKVGGVSCSFFTISNTKIGIVTPPLTAGTKTLVAKLSNGAIVNSTITYWSPVDSSTTLCLERGEYIGTTWKDRSGNGNNFASTTVYPAETNKEPCFDGLDDVITGTTANVTIASLLGNTGGAGMTYSASVMFRVNKFTAAHATTWENPGIFVDAGGWTGLHICDSWLRWLHYGGANAYVTMSQPSLNEWHVVDIEVTAGSAAWRIDGGAWSSPVSFVALGSTANVMRVGANYSTSKIFNGDVRAIIVSNVARGAAWFDSNLNWFKTRHGYGKDTNRPEADVIDSDVFDPDGGDVVRVRGRNLTTLSDIRFGTSSYVISPAIASHPLFDGTNDKLTSSVPRSSLLGGSGWTFSVLVDCRALEADAGNMTNQVLFTESAAYMGVEVFKGGARIWQYNDAGVVLYTATSGGVGNGFHLIQAKWTGSNIQIRVDGGSWATTALATIGGAGTFVFGCNYNASGAFFKGRMIEAFFSNSSLSDGNLDSVVAGVNHAYGLKVGGVTAALFDPATLPLSAYFKPGNYASDTWTGTASAGDSSGRNLSEATNYPTVVTTTAIGIKSIGDMPDFDGVNDKLVSVETFDDFFGAGDFSGWTLIYVDVAVGTAAAAVSYQNDVVFGTADNAYFVLTVRNDGIGYIHSYDSSTNSTDTPVYLHGGWNLIQWRHSGTTIYVRTNGGDWSSGLLDAMNPAGLTQVMSIGIQADSSTYFNGRIAELATTDTDIGVKGCDDVLAYINQTYGLGLGGYAPYAFDPTTLPLTFYCKAGDYATGTWTGTASAGASNGRHLTEGTNYPSVASNEVTCKVPAVSAGLTTASIPLFDGVNDTLGGPDETAPTIENVFGVSDGESAAGSYIILFRANSATAANAQVYENPALLVQQGGNSAGNGCSFSSAGVKFGHYDGTWDTLTIAADIGEWHVAQAKWNGVNLYARVLTHGCAPGAWQSIARGTYQTTAGGYLQLGLQYDNSRWFHGVIAEVMTTASTLTDAEMDNVVRYLNHRYSMRLGQYPASVFDPATMSLTTWYRSGGYSAGTWTGTASAGASSGRDLSESTAAYRPTSTTEVISSLQSITLINPSGEATLANAVQYANPGTLPNAVWWMHAQEGIVTTNAGGVSTWADQSNTGDSNKNVSPTDGAVSYRHSSAYSGKVIIDSQDGGNTRLLRAGGVWSTTHNIYTLVSVGHSLATSNRYFVFENDSMFNALLNSTGQPTVYSLLANESITGVGNLHLPRSMMIGVFNGASSKLYVEKRAAVAGSLTNTHVLGGYQGYVGSYSSDTTTYGASALADVVAYARELSTAEVRTLLRYRDSYYGKVVA